MQARRARALQFVFFAAYGTTIPFFGLYYYHVLVDAADGTGYIAVGVVLSVSMLVGILSPLVAGYLADRFRIRNRLITSLSLMVAVGAMTIYLPGSPFMADSDFATRFVVLLVGATVNGLFVRPIIPLIDTETLIGLRAGNGGVERYGEIRVFGSIGWVITASITGFVITFSGTMSVMLLLYASGFVTLALLGRTGFRSEIRSVVVPWKHLRSDRAYQRFLVFIFILSVGITGGYVYTGVYMADLGLSIVAIGLSYAVAALPEIPVLFGGRAILARLGSRGMIVGGGFFQAVKFLLLFLIAGARAPALFVLVMLLQGAGYSLQFAGFVDFMDRRAHENLRATYQSLYHIVFALGGAVGNLGASLIDRAFSSRALMAVAAGLVAASLVYFCVFVRPRLSDAGDAPT